MCFLSEKAIPEMTYTVSGFDVKPYSLTHFQIIEWQVLSVFCCTNSFLNALTDTVGQQN